MYDPITESLLDRLTETIPRERIITNARTLLTYSSDRKTSGIAASLAVQPVTTDEVGDIVRLCNESNTPIFPRGAASNSTGACVPTRPGLVLDLSRMTQIREVSPTDLSITVEAGVLTAEVMRIAEEHGLFYGPDPAGWRESTIGGNVATNAGGPSTVKYGVTRDWLLGLEVVMASGDVIWTGARTAKTAAGYDLTRLICGSGGTLGIVTAARLRLIPKPTIRQTIVAGFSDVASCMVCADQLLRSGLHPATLEFLDHLSIEMAAEEFDLALTKDAEALLLLAFDGNEVGVAADLGHARDILNEHASGTFVPDTPSDIDRIWRTRERLSPLLQKHNPLKINEDVCVPRSALPEFLRQLEIWKATYGMPVPTFGHLADGNLHVNIMHTNEQRGRAVELREELMALVLKLGGTITGEHGVGLVKKDWLAKELSDANLAAQRAVKAALDPRGILNPDKIFPDG